jgi:lipoprotein-anchoring transpeptidase ErfK/SrfK
MTTRRALAVAFSAVVLGLSTAEAREIVPFRAAVEPGTVLVKTQERRLYLVREDGTAVRYPVAVGKRGKQWFGEARIDGKYVEPAWAPPDDVKRDNPRLPDFIPGGAPNNPMGIRALTLNRGEYAIHGTNRPDSIGTFASYGCIRMHNRDILDLFERVRVGTRVLVTR